MYEAVVALGLNDIYKKWRFTPPEFMQYQTVVLELTEDDQGLYFNDKDGRLWALRVKLQETQGE